MFRRVKGFFYFRTLLIVGFVPIAAAMPIKSKIIKKQVSVVDADNRPLQTLDLKAKSLTLGRQELELCGANLVRKGQTMTYSCTIAIPLKSKVTRLQNLTSAKTLDSIYAGTKRQVVVDVSADGRNLTLSTRFDSTGIDFEISKFNDDFFAVYAQAAHTIISEALKKQTIKMEVLESRQ